MINEDVVEIPKITHHTKIPQEFNLLGTYPSFHDPDDKDFFFKYKNSHLVVWSYLETKKRYITSQDEFPLKILPWVLIQLGRFDRPESQGGIPSDQISDVMELDGETVGIAVGPCMGGPNIPGYDVWNRSRRIKPNSRVFQNFVMPTPWLQGGFLDFWESLTHKVYPNGWTF
ncbi:hypothetical protein [Algicola sagamiensis]|uniref:hypothetical protein n=1 Tax=Algicola sagamiensis TaxID=163869 RepID=UPI0003675960|nr:hypothetical protein [Algicola sagamiensis]